ncbi:hypothetical protein G6F40_017763 [Rhizopus arrhizus]|nr:hypothetical protein G6F40_017763 [Rhizopus arrhizus]
MAPKGTPPAVLARLTEVTQKFWADPAARAQMAQIYMLPPAEFGGQAVTQAMQRESATWGPIIKRLGIQND